MKTYIDSDQGKLERMKKPLLPSLQPAESKSKKLELNLWKSLHAVIVTVMHQEMFESNNELYL